MWLAADGTLLIGLRRNRPMLTSVVRSARTSIRADPNVGPRSERRVADPGTRSELNRPQRGSQPTGFTGQAAIPMGSGDGTFCTRVSPLREATLRFDLTPLWGALEWTTGTYRTSCKKLVGIRLKPSATRRFATYRIHAWSTESVPARVLPVAREKSDRTLHPQPLPLAERKEGTRSGSSSPTPSPSEWRRGPEVIS